MSTSFDWLADERRDSVAFIRENNLLQEGRTWGFAVIRPSGAAADHAQWDVAMMRLRGCVVSSCREYDEALGRRRFQMGKRNDDSPLDPTPTDIMLEKLQLPVLDLPLEPGQSSRHEPSEPRNQLLVLARARFRQFVEEEEKLGRETVCHRACLVLDATAVEKLVNLRLAPEDCHIIVLDPDESRIEKNFYSAWMWAQPLWLAELYSALRIMDMITFCPIPKFEGQLPLYTGASPNALINPPGGIGPALGGTTRGKGRGI